MYKALFIILIFSSSLYSQNTEEKKYDLPLSLSLSYQEGKVFETNKFLGGINSKEEPISNYFGVSLLLETHTQGKNLWEQFYNYPSYGLGVTFYELGNSEEIGNPISIFWNYSAPFKRWDKFSIEYELGLGLAFNWNKYSTRNVYNIAIGSNVTLHSDFGLKVSYLPVKRLKLSAAMVFSHFSNGSLQTPNMGINMVAPKFELSYNLNYEKINYNRMEVPEFKGENEILISPFFAIKNISYKDLGLVPQDTYGISFPIYGFSVLYNRHISYMSKIGIGFNTSYDESLNITIYSINGGNNIDYGDTNDNFTLSIIGSYDLVFGRFSLLLQPSFYVYRKSTHSPDLVFHQRIGIKYKVTDKFYALVALRSNQFREADYIEWTIVYDVL